MPALHWRARSLAIAFWMLLAPAATVVAQGLSLTELLERVHTHYPRIAAADARVAGVRGARRAAGVFPNPVLGFTVENATLPGREPAGDMDRETMATATIPLEFLYQRGVRVRRADAELVASRADAFAERQRIALAAARAYYRVAQAQVEVATAEDLSRWLDSLVAYNRARAAEGAAAEADLLRAELERDQASSELTMRRAELIRASAELRAFTADSAEPGHLVTAVTTPDLPLGLPSPDIRPVAAGSRPEVEAARSRLTAAGAGVGVARSMLVREVSAMTGLKWSAGTTTLLAGVSLPFPLVDQNRGELARARAERDAATLELAAVEREVQADLSGATEAAGLLTARIGELRGPADSVTGAQQAGVRQLARADEVRRIALGAYREGAVPLLQVLDAARAWGEARVSYYRTLYSQHESVLLLLVAQGRDLFTAIPAANRGAR